MFSHKKLQHEIDELKTISREKVGLYELDHSQIIICDSCGGLFSYYYCKHKAILTRSNIAKKVSYCKRCFSKLEKKT